MCHPCCTWPPPPHANFYQFSASLADGTIPKLCIEKLQFKKGKSTPRAHDEVVCYEIDFLIFYITIITTISSFYHHRVYYFQVSMHSSPCHGPRTYVHTHKHDKPANPILRLTGHLISSQEFASFDEAGRQQTMHQKMLLI